MSLEEQIRRFNCLDEWFDSHQGYHVAKVINKELSYLKHMLHGDILIQFGKCGADIWWESLRFQYKWLFQPQMTPTKIHCSAMCHQLPIDRNSIDCIITPFSLDAFQIKEILLDEMDRVIKPMGFIVLIGINLWSLWGLWLKLSPNACFGVLKGFPKSALTLKRAMIRRGYGQCYYNTFYFIPPVKKKYLLQPLAFLNQMGKMTSPMPAAFYCLVMQKYVDGYTDPLFAIDKKKMIDTALYQPV